jgi:hypothetical protein
MHRLIRLPHMQRVGIGIRIDCDGANAHGARGADDPASNFAAIAMRRDLSIYLFSMRRQSAITLAFKQGVCRFGS